MDLVERLRRGSLSTFVQHEAADEIERLRKERNEAFNAGLEAAAKVCDEDEHSSGNYHRDLIRALEKK